MTGYYKPVTCGASCSPASIEWRSRGVLYEIAFKVDADGDAARATLIGMAGEAILAGGR